MSPDIDFAGLEASFNVLEILEALVGQARLASAKHFLFGLPPLPAGALYSIDRYHSKIQLHVLECCDQVVTRKFSELSGADIGGYLSLTAQGEVAGRIAADWQALYKKCATSYFSLPERTNSPDHLFTRLAELILIDAVRIYLSATAEAWFQSIDTDSLDPVPSLYPLFSEMLGRLESLKALAVREALRIGSQSISSANIIAVPAGEAAVVVGRDTTQLVPKTKGRVTANLQKLREEAGMLSYNEMGILTDTDPKNVAAHFKGTVKPVDKTLAGYAKMFTTALKRPITLDDLYL